MRDSGTNTDDAAATATPAVARAIASAYSNHPDAARAAQMAAEDLLGVLDAAAPKQETTFAVVFLSKHHVGGAAKIAGLIRRRLALGSGGDGPAGALIGCSTETVIAGGVEHEQSPGVSILAARLPGARATVFSTNDLPLVYAAASGAMFTPGDDAASVDGEAAGDADRLATATGIDEGHRGTILFTDPFTPALSNLLPAMSAARRRAARARVSRSAGEPAGAARDSIALAADPLACPFIGGIASASSRPGGNALIAGDRVLASGVVGLTLRGAVRVDTLVSQGCRAFGPTFIVTGARGNVVRSLSGKPALQALNEAIEELSEADRDKLRKGVFLGRVVDEYKDRFGRGDYLIRHVMGVSRESREIAINDTLRVGQTVRFHLRDARSATEDLELALDAQRLHSRPLGALLVTCNGRGRRMFDRASHDASALARLLAPPEPAEAVAKPGTAFVPDRPAPPIAGMHASGEIGPVGGTAFVHGFTACAAIFRDDEPDQA